MKILGVDPGLANTGWALLEHGQVLAAGVVATKRHKGKVGDAQRRLTELGAELYQLVFRAQLVVVEWPGGGFGRNAGSAAQTNLAAGVAAGLAWGAGRQVMAPAPITWRSRLGHKRGADEQLHAELAQRFPDRVAALLEHERPHVLDAIGLAIFGELVTTPPKRAQLALVS